MPPHSAPPSFPLPPFPPLQDAAVRCLAQPGCAKSAVECTTWDIQTTPANDANGDNVQWRKCLIALPGYALDDPTYSDKVVDKQDTCAATSITITGGGSVVDAGSATATDATTAVVKGPGTCVCGVGGAGSEGVSPRLLRLVPPRPAPAPTPPQLTSPPPPPPAPCHPTPPHPTPLRLVPAPLHPTPCPGPPFRTTTMARSNGTALAAVPRGPAPARRTTNASLRSLLRLRPTRS